MMRLDDCKKAYYEFSGRLSDNCRRLAFAGIAIVWIFRQGETPSYCLDSTLAWVSVFLVLSLSFDLFQYIYQTILWGWYHRYKEKRMEGKDESFLVPRWFNWTPVLFMFSKTVCVIIAYIMIFSFLCCQVQVQ